MKLARDIKMVINPNTKLYMVTGSQSGESIDTRYEGVELVVAFGTIGDMLFELAVIASGPKLSRQKKKGR